MMKCAVIFVSVLAFCYSSPISGDNRVSINKDGSIQILGKYGKWIVISKDGHNVEKDIEIAVGGPSGVHKKIHINEVTTSKSVGFEEPLKEKINMEQNLKSPSDILTGIFQQYQGVVDEKSYNNLLKKVSSHVHSGDLDHAVYDILKDFNDLNNDNQVRETVNYVHSVDSDDQIKKMFDQDNDNQFDKTFDASSVIPFGWYGYLMSSPSFAIKKVVRVSKMQVRSYQPQEKLFYQQWMNQMNQQDLSEQQSYETYLQLTNIEQSVMSPEQGKQLLTLAKLWRNFHNQLSPIEVQRLSHLYQQWINREEGLTSKQYQSDTSNIQRQWNDFQQNLNVEKIHLLNVVYKKWVELQQELSLQQLGQLEHLWSEYYQRWVKMGLTTEQQQQIGDILVRLTNYNNLREIGKWTPVQQQHYKNLLNRMAKLIFQLNVEQQQELNNVYQIVISMSRLQINPGEWIQLKQKLENFIRQLDFTQQEGFFRIYQQWVILVENLVNFEQYLQNVFEQWALLHEQLNHEQLQQFRNIYPQWEVLRIQKANGVWNRFHVQQYEILTGQLMEFLKQLSTVQQQTIDSLQQAGARIIQQKITDKENWYMLEYHLDVFVQRMLESYQQSLQLEDLQQFHEIYKFWEESVSRRINMEQSESPVLLEPQQSMWYLQGRQTIANYPWNQKVQQKYVVPQQFLDRIFY